jgi:hypothetical protein
MFSPCAERRTLELCFSLANSLLHYPALFFALLFPYVHYDCHVCVQTELPAFPFSFFSSLITINHSSDDDVMVKKMENHSYDFAVVLTE